MSDRDNINNSGAKSQGSGLFRNSQGLNVASQPGGNPSSSSSTAKFNSDTQSQGQTGASQTGNVQMNVNQSKGSNITFGATSGGAFMSQPSVGGSQPASNTSGVFSGNQAKFTINQC